MRFSPESKISSKFVLYLVAIITVSFVVCIFTWQDLHLESLKVQSGVYDVYRLTGELIRHDGILSLFDSKARVASPDFVSHPPGYSLLIALILGFTNEPKNALQLISLLSVTGSAVVIFLSVNKLLTMKIAFVTGILTALAPQFASSAIPLLPDVLSVFPVLLGLFFFICAYRNPRLPTIIFVGICLGAACWLRSNYLLLPFFFIPAFFLLFEQKKFWVYSATLIVSFILTIAPITIRNAVVYGKFIPLSIGAGQTLLEGIGDYDPEEKLGIPSTDAGIMQMEAQQTGCLDYANSLFGSEGIERDRARINLGLQVIRENPLWFTGVAIRRAASMLKLERSPIISPDIPVSALPENQSSALLQSASGTEIKRGGRLISAQAELTENAESQALILQTDRSKYGAQFAIATFPAQKNRNYAVQLYLKLAQGRVSLKIIGTDSGQTYSSKILTRDDFCSPPKQTTENLLFVPNRDESITVLISNEVIEPPTSILEISRLDIYEAGEASQIWTRPLRLITHYSQKAFKTAVILPMAIFGLVILIRRKNRDALIALGVIPIYFFCVQSILHTEYRYILALYYVLFTFAAVFLDWFGTLAFEKIKNHSTKNISA